MKLFQKKKPAHAYDPTKEKPVIRASICTGEQAAGFKDLKTGAFHEVMLILNDADLRTFMKMYGLQEVEKEY